MRNLKTITFLNLDELEIQLRDRRAWNLFLFGIIFVIASALLNICVVSVRIDAVFVMTGLFFTAQVHFRSAE